MIDITKPVRTRNGTPVEIISDKGREPYTLVGYIGNGRELDEWAADGAYLPGTKSNNDLENYKPEPQPDADGWIPHIPGDPMPCNNDQIVDVKLGKGTVHIGVQGTEDWQWSAFDVGRSSIAAWRPHKSEPQPEEWAAEKAAFAAGKVIQYRGSESSMWHDTVIPTWQPCCQYRIKPEPQWVPLGPEDVPPGSVIRGPLWGNHSWSSINVSDFGVIWLGIDRFSGVGNHEMSWGRLMESGFEIKRPSEDWKPCKKEAVQ
jgi:hypothetical protein